MIRKILTVLALCTTVAFSSGAHAAQNTLTTPGAPLTMTVLATFLNNALSTVATNYSGSTPPAVCAGSTACTYQYWMDTSTSLRALRIYDGASWVQMGTLDPTGHVFVPTPTGEIPNSVSASTYTFVDADRFALKLFSNSSAAVSLPQAGSGSPATFISGWYVDVKNSGTGTVTITPTTSTIDGLASIALAPGKSVRIASDGTNYYTGLSVGSYFNSGLNISTPYQGAPALYFQNNSASTYPATQIVSGAITNNFSSGGGETNFWNLTTTAVTAFDFSQMLTSSSRRTIMTLQSSGGVSIGTPTDPGLGNLIANGSVQAGSVVTSGGITSGTGIQVGAGDLYLSRTDTAAAFITRPNSVGYKTIYFSVVGGGNLDAVNLNTNSFGVNGTATIVSTLTASNGGFGGSAPSIAKLFVNSNAVTTEEDYSAYSFSPIVALKAVDGANAILLFDVYGAQGNFSFRRANNIASSKTGLVDGNSIGQITWRGYTSAGAYSSNSTALIGAYAVGTWTSSSTATMMRFFTTPSSAITSVEAMRINASSGVGIGTPSDPGAQNLIVNGTIALNGGAAYFSDNSSAAFKFLSMGGQNYIESSNSAYNANATLNITGYAANALTLLNLTATTTTTYGALQVGGGATFTGGPAGIQADILGGGVLRMKSGSTSVWNNAADSNNFAAGNTGSTLSFNNNGGSPIFTLSSTGDGVFSSTLTSYGNSSQYGIGGGAANQNIYRANGSIGSLTQVLAGNALLNWGAYGYGSDNAYHGKVAAIQVHAIDSFTSTTTGVYMDFHTTTGGTTTQIEVLRLQGSGGVSVGPAAVTTDPGINNLLVGGTIAAASTTDQSGAGTGALQVAGGASFGKSIYLASDPGCTSSYALCNNAGNLYFNGVALATGSSISGTTNYLPVFTGASTLGNSIVQQSGSDLKVSSNLVSMAGSSSAAVSWWGDISTARWTTTMGGYGMTWMNDYSTAPLSGGPGPSTLSANSETFYPRIAFLQDGSIYSSGSIISIQAQNANTYISANNQNNGASAFTSFILSSYGNQWYMQMGSAVNNSNAFQLSLGGTSSPKLQVNTSGGVSIGSTTDAGATSSKGNLLVGGMISSLVGNQPYVSLANYASLNAAIAALPAGGGTIGVPAGVWDQGSTCASYSGTGTVNIIGESPGLSVILFSGNVSGCTNGAIAMTYTGAATTLAKQKPVVRDVSIMTSYVGNGSSGNGNGLYFAYDTIQTNGSLGPQISRVNMGYYTSNWDGGSNYIAWTQAIVFVNARQPTIENTTIQGAAHTTANHYSDSSTSITASVASKTWTVGAGRDYYVGECITAADHGNPTVNQAYGVVTAYSGTTLTVNVTSVTSGFTSSSWDFYPLLTSNGGVYVSGPVYGDVNNVGTAIRLMGYTVVPNILNVSMTDLQYGIYISGTVEGPSIIAPQCIDCVWGIYAEGQDASTITTSSTSLTVGTGSKTLTVGSGLDYWPTQPIYIYETGTPGNNMSGTITSYSGTTLVVSIASTNGSGTHTDWSVNQNHLMSVIVVKGGSFATINGAWYGDWTAFTFFDTNEVQQRGGNNNYVDMQWVGNNTVASVHDNIFTDYHVINAPNGISVLGVSTNSLFNAHDNTFRSRGTGIWAHSGANTNSVAHNNFGGAGNSVTTTFKNDAGWSYYNNNI